MNLKHYLKNEEDLKHLATLLGEERVNRFLELSANILDSSPSMKEFEDFVNIIRMLQFMEEQKDLPWWRSENFVVSCYFQLKYYHTGIILVDPAKLECGFYLIFKGSLFVSKRYDKILKVASDETSKSYKKIMAKARKNAIPLIPDEFKSFA